MGRTARITRPQVLSAAREAFVDGGYAGTTLADIASRLGVSPAAILRHAPTKQALFAAAMGQSPEPELTPLQFLEDCDGSEDPRDVLRRVALAMIPFLESKLRESVARWIYFKKVPGVGHIPLPFDPQARSTAPQKNLRFLEDYMRRALRKGRLRKLDPGAAAMAFLATVHSFVFLQHVMQIPEEPMPQQTYVDTVLDVWTRGAFRSVSGVRSPDSGSGGKRRPDPTREGR
ncbi:MAG TPA: TetR/AcrR family transcriptional regulator [Thermoanaerobaculia bacterium]|jgi:AcrR family transcriptional regulator